MPMGLASTLTYPMYSFNSQVSGIKTLTVYRRCIFQVDFDFNYLPVFLFSIKVKIFEETRGKFFETKES